tara:strand:- start:4035 stop:4211 length:177 start_codon:yes stop_codon:yes gene_type:complete
MPIFGRLYPNKRPRFFMENSEEITYQIMTLSWFFIVGLVLVMVSYDNTNLLPHHQDFE